MTFIIVIIALALIFDYINGFHDAANSIATVVSTKVLTPFQAVVWAAVFNFAAYFIFKDHGVADTVSKTVHSKELGSTVMLTVVFSGLIAAICWNLMTWWFGIPSSSSHTLIGGFAGAGIAAGGISAVNTDVVVRTVAFIFAAPLVGMFFAFIISVWFMVSFRKALIPRLISLGVIAGIVLTLIAVVKTNRADISGMKIESAQGQAHIKEVANKSSAQLMGFKKEDILLAVNGTAVTGKKELDEVMKATGNTGNTFSYTVLRKGDTLTKTTPYITHYQSRFSQVLFFGENFKWFLLGFILMILAMFTLWLNRLNTHRSNVWFKRLQLVSSAAFSIGHGGNDAQKVMGIITAALIANGTIDTFEQMPTWVPLACYTAIGLGTMSGGWKIIKTMGTRITKVTPFEGVAAETAGAVTLFVTEYLKIPVSTTHTITGSIMGVGATKRLSAVRWGVTINLLWAWVLTIPVSAVLAAIVYYIVRLFI
ncbi:PDZ domain-containing protein [Flaviaesturariibacter flavus]|uniref:Phosphate transporter n=1 Tax=Flaviaesturariibacter flavus TaxID=2502780 RepID=A0A4R1BMN2_9BACT|nr:inorganic phosphate transporter [Flaviaesturariibacter flavus]TCJ18780.1 PDZ domain-containing protein [Flaviaesturariibacter flavus]